MELTGISHADGGNLRAFVDIGSRNTAMNDSDIVHDFLIESYENLDRLDRELVGLESNPDDGEALASIFRTIHTIKGTCGFLGFSKLEAVAHGGENLLARLRDRHLSLTPEITTALLGMVDAVRQMLGQIESSGKEGEWDDSILIATLTRLQQPADSPRPVPTLGAILIDRAVVTQEEVQLAVKKQADGDPRHMGEILIESGAVRQSDVVEALRVQQAARGVAVSDSTIRVDVELLDRVMTLVGELVLARNQIVQFAHLVKEPTYVAALQRLSLITGELRADVMKARMQPIGNIWGQFPRTVRDVAHGCGKMVAIEMEGKDTELDKTIIEAIKDPLTHLVRNSVDHGIELPDVRVRAGKDPTGRLTLRAFHEGGQVNIEISDDGGGMNVERILKKAVERNLVTSEQAGRMTERDAFNLIFLPGFSTAAIVTNVSGRGVGMDVVKTNVERIGGTVDVQSTFGKGTTVRVKIPLTLAIIPALVVTCWGDRYAIPQVSLLELLRLKSEEAGEKIELVHGAPVYRLRGRLLPLVYLGQELNLGQEGRPALIHDAAINIVVLQAGERQFGLVVDRINDTEEIVVKPLRKQLKSTGMFAGSSVMGDGRVALILDVLGLAQRAGVLGGATDGSVAEKNLVADANIAEKQTFLLFTGPGNSRMAIPLAILARLEEFPVAQIEVLGGQWVTQYRGTILPLIRLNLVMAEQALRSCLLTSLPPIGSDRIQVLVLNHDGRPCGLVVDRIIDIVSDSAEVKSAATRPGVLHSVVIGECVTELLDVPALMREADAARGRSEISRKAEVVH
jgi:two-component system, chemotaxis family, sensor kinase CheA